LDLSDLLVHEDREDPEGLEDLEDP
jgi:hypothetical protein